MKEFSEELQLKIYQDKYTLEDISNYIKANKGKAVNIDKIDLWECKETESDSKYEDSLDDDDVIAYYDGKYVFDMECPWPDDVVKVVLEKGISLDELPEELLFNLSFVSEYIEHVSVIKARETEQKGITPQDIEDASSSTKLGDFESCTRQIKERVKGKLEITTEDKDKDD